MTANGMRPVHPGEILRQDYLRGLGLSANALARALAVPAPRINDIVRERRGISADTALRLAHDFRTTPQFWLNLQSTFDLRVAEIASGRRIRREVKVMSTAASQG
jgi:addiction module HigA family antidote